MDLVNPNYVNVYKVNGTIWVTFMNRSAMVDLNCQLDQIKRYQNLRDFWMIGMCYDKLRERPTLNVGMEQKGGGMRKQ